MSNLPLVIAAVAVALGGYLLVSGLSSEDHLSLLGAMIPSKFGILLGGVGIFAGVAIAVESLSKRKPKQPVKVASH